MHFKWFRWQTLVSETYYISLDVYVCDLTLTNKLYQKLCSPVPSTILAVSDRGLYLRAVR